MKFGRSLSWSMLVGATLAATVAVLPAGAATTTTLLTAGESWEYHDLGTDLGSGWRSAGYSSANWSRGAAPLGYGNEDDASQLEEHLSTYYFRKTIFAPAGAAELAANMRVRYDDGAVVYVNGAEVWRANVPAGQDFDTSASEYKVGAEEQEWHTVTLPEGTFIEGNNVVAVEVHNFGKSSSDISLDLSVDLLGQPAAISSDPGTASVMCKFTDPRLAEVSGLASSVKHPGILWTHNDSGDAAQVYAVDYRTCAVEAVVKLNGVTATDFEAMSMGLDANGKPELWVGDIGDNGGSRSNVRLHRFPEPDVLADQGVAVRTVTVTWSDGRRDSESLMVDPIPNGNVYLVSKEMSAGIYQLRGDYRHTGDATTGTRISAARPYATDAAIAPDRSQSVLRSGNYGTLLNGTPPTGSEYKFMFPSQPQGEAVAFSTDSRYLFIASEGFTNLIRIPVETL